MKELLKEERILALKNPLNNQDSINLSDSKHLKHCLRTNTINLSMFL